MVTSRGLGVGGVVRRLALGAVCSGLLTISARSETAVSPGVVFGFRFPEPSLWVAVPDQARVGAVMRAHPPGRPEEVAVFGRRVVLQVAGATEPWAWLNGRPLVLTRKVQPGLWILEAPDAWTAATQAADLALGGEVQASYPVVSWPVELAGLYAPAPRDANFVNQWSLEHRGAGGWRSGVDLNVRAAWPYTRGAGATIAVGDTGLALSHVELIDRVAGAPHFNFALGTEDGAAGGTSGFWAHGTGVAGLAVATLEVGRMAGVAPEAAVAGWVLFDANTALVSNEQLMDMFGHASDVVAVQNHSWNRPGLGLLGLTNLEQVGYSNAVHHGRGGRGSLLVRSAGNGRLSGANANDDGYAQDPRGIAVAAVYQDGRVIDESEPGACVWVAAPSNHRDFGGLFTTDLPGIAGANPINFFPPNEDLSDYRFDSVGMGGTSAAAALISGVSALLVSANPGLNRRDAQQLLLLSARHFDWADPGLATNAAGFVVSHNVGFGIPDAGYAVRLALNWPNRPPNTRVEVVSTGITPIPDSGLGVEVTGPAVPSELSWIEGLPGTGLHPDSPTAWVPLRDLGVASPPIVVDLTGQGALILRGGGPKAVLVEQLQRAADAGASFGLLYNYPVEQEEPDTAPGGEELTPLAGTDFLPMPVLFIGNRAGEGLRALSATNAAARARLRLLTADRTFEVGAPLLCEHVGVRLRTDHPLRGDLRITLLSPGGTRSVLQRYNGDLTAGPTDWTYWSTHHFGESSLGTWTLSVSDQYAEAAGSILEATLILLGVSIVDTDADGLDDRWETTWLETLDHGPRDDPDDDGISNAREQLIGSHPAEPDLALGIDLAFWSRDILRLSWPGRPGRTYEVWSGSDWGELSMVGVVGSVVPETEWFGPLPSNARQFYQVREVE